LTDALPGGTTFVSVAAPMDYLCTTPSVGANGTVECFGISVPVNTTQTFTVTAQVNANAVGGTMITNTASLTGAQGDNPVNITTNAATVTVTGATAVRLRSFAAVATARGVSLRWGLASQADVLGFNVYRQVGAKRTRVNARLIRAHAAGGYSLLDRRAQRAAPARYWLQIVNLDGSRAWYGPARVRRSAR
jgi:hypothetical protein